MLKTKFFIIMSVLFLCLNCTTKKSNQTSECMPRQSYEPNNKMPSMHLVADTFYEDGFNTPLIENIRIYRDEKQIYQDTMTIFEGGSEKKILYNDTILYFLMKAFDPTTLKTLHVYKCSADDKVVATIVEGQMIKDIDGDGILEIIGQEFTETLDVDHNCITYSPIMVYKMGEYFSWDEALTIELTTHKYGCYLGDKCMDTFLNSKTIEYNGITIW